MESPVSAQEQISLFPQEDRTKTANTAAYTIIFFIVFANYLIILTMHLKGQLSMKMVGQI